MIYWIKKIKARQHYTLLGIVALFLWSTSSTCLSFISTLPDFQLLCLIFLAAFTFCFINFLRDPQIDTLKAPIKVWISLFFTLILQPCFYVSAIQRSPPEEVDMLFYLWPLISILGFAHINKTRPRTYQIISSILGMTAVICIFNTSKSFNTFSFGHFLALSGSLTWGLFCAYVGKLPKIHPNMIGLMLGVGTIVFACTHILTETFITTSRQDIWIIMYYGMCIIFGANTLWTLSQQNNPSASLALLAYAKPAISLSLLALFGFTETTHHLFLGIICILLSTSFSNGYPWQIIKQYMPCKN